MNEEKKKHPLFTKAHKAGIALFLFFFLVGLPISVWAISGTSTDVQISGDNSMQMKAFTPPTTDSDPGKPIPETKNDEKVQSINKSVNWIKDQIESGNYKDADTVQYGAGFIGKYTVQDIKGPLTEAQRKQLQGSYDYIKKLASDQDKLEAQYTETLKINPDAPRPKELLSPQYRENTVAWLNYLKKIDEQSNPRDEDASERLSVGGQGGTTPAAGGGAGGGAAASKSTTGGGGTAGAVPKTAPQPVKNIYTNPPLAKGVTYTPGGTMTTSLNYGQLVNSGYSANPADKYLAYGSPYGSVNNGNPYNYGQATMRYYENTTNPALSAWQMIGFGYGQGQDPLSPQSLGNAAPGTQIAPGVEKTQGGFIFTGGKAEQGL